MKTLFGMTAAGMMVVMMLVAALPGRAVAIPDSVTPPVVTDPDVTPPVEDPVTPPVVTDPDVTPPVEDPVTPPVVTDPDVTPPVEDPVTPPVVTNPVTPPVVTNPVTPPVVTNPDVTTTVPGTVENVTLAKMISIKKLADKAVQAANMQKEKAKTFVEKRIAKDLLKQAQINAEVAGELLEAVKAGEEVSREEADACVAIAEAVHKATDALAAGNTRRAEDVLDSIAELGDRLPTAANARAEMQMPDVAVRNQSFTVDDIKKIGKPAELATNMPVAAEMKKVDVANNKKSPLKNKNVPFCKGNNIMNANGTFFASCKEKKCVDVPYGALCIPQEPVCSEKKKEQCASNPSPSSLCLRCRQSIIETCISPDGTKKINTTLTEWYCK
jgi:hypothetical protein